MGANKSEVSLIRYDIPTRDGVCPAYAFHPESAAPSPGVLMFMDGQGIRPAMLEVAERLSRSGYFVVLPDLFYRSGPYAPIDPRHLHANPELRAAHREKFMAPTTPERVMSDTGSILEFMATHPDKAPGQVGVVGYCMGGRFAMMAAGTFCDAIGAAASYHGGGLATDAASSPHLLAPDIKARVYVAGAVEDANFTDEMKARLESALQAGGVAHKVETYPARHGWVLRDTAAYDEAECAHHWDTLLELFGEALKRPESPSLVGAYKI